MTARPRAADPKGFVRILAMFYRWAEAGWAASAVALWTLLQGSIVPGPVDALFIPLSLADPGKVWRFAFAATVGSLAGALCAYAIGHFAFDEVGRPLLALIGVSEPELVGARKLFAQKGWMLVLISTFTPISSKVVSITAGAFGVPLPVFALTMFVGRAARFAATAALLRYAGAGVERWIERRYGATLAELAGAPARSRSSLSPGTGLPPS